MVNKKHKRAFFWLGNMPLWLQHKATCVECGGTAPIIQIASPPPPPPPVEVKP